VRRESVADVLLAKGADLTAAVEEPVVHTESSTSAAAEGHGAAAAAVGVVMSLAAQGAALRRDGVG